MTSRAAASESSLSLGIEAAPPPARRQEQNLQCKSSLSPALVKPARVLAGPAGLRSRRTRAGPVLFFESQVSDLRVDCERQCSGCWLDCPSCVACDSCFRSVVCVASAGKWQAVRAASGNRTGVPKRKTVPETAPALRATATATAWGSVERSPALHPAHPTACGLRMPTSLRSSSSMRGCSARVLPFAPAFGPGLRIPRR